jgi:hypothetical protein
MHGVSREDLRNHLSRVNSLIIRCPRTSNINRFELVPVALEESLESGIRQIYRALPVKNDDS